MYITETNAGTCAIRLLMAHAQLKGGLGKVDKNVFTLGFPETFDAVCVSVCATLSLSWFQLNDLLDQLVD